MEASSKVAQGRKFLRVGGEAEASDLKDLGELVRLLGK